MSLWDRLDAIDRRIDRVVPRHSVPVGAVVVPLGKAAEKSRLWLAIAAALGLSGGRFRRRAALRGLLAGGLATVLANGPLKVVSRRRRPTLSRVTRRLPGFSDPVTSSFPSSHAATAFAFATGVAQESPSVGAPTMALAAAVSYSRVHSGVHHPTDVVAGAALGMGVGLATRRLWPVRRRLPAHAPAAGGRATVDPSPRGQGLVVVANPDAGPRTGPSPAEEVQADLPEAKVVSIEDGADLDATLRREAESAVAIGVAGGDGSVNTAAQVAADLDKPLLVVPAGTLNHFAESLGLGSVADAIEVVQEGRVVAADRAVIDGHTFVNTASFGSYVALVDAREKLEKAVGKWPAVFLALARVLWRSEPVDVVIDGQPRQVWMMFVGNCRYHPPGFAPSWRERLDDGELDIRTVDGNRPLARTRLLLSVLTGRLARCRVYEQRFASSVSVRSRQGPLRLARDGETFEGSESFTIEKADRPLRVYAACP